MAVVNIFLFSILSLVGADRADAAPSLQESKNTVLVTSAVRHEHAMTADDKILFMKSFDVTIRNGSDQPIDLSKGCFKAVLPGRGELSVDTISEELATGIITSGASRKGFAGFSSPDENAYKAIAVKYEQSCK